MSRNAAVFGPCTAVSCAGGRVLPERVRQAAFTFVMMYTDCVIPAGDHRDRGAHKGPV
jgi:hypothetical protein